LALVAVTRGLLFPNAEFPIALGTSGTMDLTDERFAMIGRCYIDGRPAGTKTISAAGGGSIAFRTGAVTFTAAGPVSTLELGIQDVSTTAGPIAQPDGTFDVSRVLDSSVVGDRPVTTSWNSFAMTGGSGSKAIAHSDLIAVVWNMTARNGTDSVLIATTRGSMYYGGAAGTGGMGLPVTNGFVAAAWQTTSTLGAAQQPNVIITFDDGTIGWLDGSFGFSTVSQETWIDSNPDERGLMWTQPWDCKIDALWFFGGITDASSGIDLKLWQDPTGTPAAPSGFTAITIDPNQIGVAANNYFHLYTLPTEVALTAGVNYAVTIRSTGSTNARLGALTLGAPGHRVQFLGDTELFKVTRDNDTGAFTPEASPVTIYSMGVRISQFKTPG
jgi:hypothetical protein